MTGDPLLDGVVTGLLAVVAIVGGFEIGVRWLAAIVTPNQGPVDDR